MHQKQDQMWFHCLKIAFIKTTPRVLAKKWKIGSYWWEYKIVQLLWKTVWKFLQKLKIEPPDDPANSLLSIYLKELKGRSRGDIYIPSLYICSLRIFAPAAGKQPHQSQPHGANLSSICIASKNPEVFLSVFMKKFWDTCTSILNIVFLEFTVGLSNVSCNC